MSAGSAAIVGFPLLIAIICCCCRRHQRLGLQSGAYITQENTIVSLFTLHSKQMLRFALNLNCTNIGAVISALRNSKDSDLQSRALAALDQITYPRLDL